MTMTEYETTLVIRPDSNGDSIEATLDRLREAVKQKGGKLLAINHWGKKRLAYEIAKQTRGVYVHTQYLGKGDLVAEVERNLRIADNVMRYLTVRVADGIDAGTRDTAEYVRPAYDQADEPEDMGHDDGMSMGPGDEGPGHDREPYARESYEGGSNEAAPAVDEDSSN